MAPYRGLTESPGIKLFFLLSLSLGQFLAVSGCSDSGCHNRSSCTAEYRGAGAQAQDAVPLVQSKVSSEEDRTALMIKQECGIDLAATSGDAASKPLLGFKKPLALTVKGQLTELTDMIAKDKNASNFLDSIVNIASLVTGKDFTLDADLNLNFESSLTASSINFSGKVTKLSLDRFDNSTAITKLLTNVGNALAAGMLSRSITSEMVSIKERTHSNNPQMMNTLCTLMLTKRMTIQSMAKTTVVFDPPIPSAISPFAKDSIYDDQLGEGFTVKSTATIESTDNKMLTAGTNFPITVTIKRVPLEQIDYCAQPVGNASIFRLTMETDDPALLGNIGMMPQLDFFKKKGAVGETFLALGADAGISIVKKPLCIPL